MDATTNQIKFTTNDMELGIETIVEGHIEEKGMVALDAKIFYEIIRRLPDNDVTITTDSNYVATITCEKAKLQFPEKQEKILLILPMIEKDESTDDLSVHFERNDPSDYLFYCSNEKITLMTGEFLRSKDNCLKISFSGWSPYRYPKDALKKEYSDRKMVVPAKH